MTPFNEEDNKIKERPSRARYDKARVTLERKWRRRELKSDRMMREVVDALWDNFAGAPYAWCGFYLLGNGGLVLSHHRDKPAPSPLPMDGLCGAVAQKGAPMIVPEALEGQSEIALPVFDYQGKVWAVLDVRGQTPNAFDEMDQRWLERILKTFQDIGRPE